ncbi:MAG: hypothetical protein GXO64_01565, partial [Candidatus Micrarchaeota archaeon]|nr:hypothetical protein [Candidatus Micrarchaeota archaeon]
NKSLAEDYANGRLDLCEALFEGHEALVKKNFTQDDWDKLIEESITSYIRDDLVKILSFLKRKNIKIILSTKGSYYAASILARRLGFDNAIGSEEIFDSRKRLIGLRTLLYGKREKIDSVEIVTGSNIIENKMKLKPQNIAFIYDEFTDVLVMRNGGLFIFIDFEQVPWRILSNISIKFKIFDIAIKENDINKLPYILNVA